MRVRTWSQMLPIMSASPGRTVELLGLSPPPPREYGILRVRYAEQTRFNQKFGDRLSKIAIWLGIKSGNASKIWVFPHFFPQLWKTRAGDPAGIAGGRDCNIAAVTVTNAVHWGPAH